MILDGIGIDDDIESIKMDDEEEKQPPIMDDADLLKTDRKINNYIINTMAEDENQHDDT